MSRAADAASGVRIRQAAPEDAAVVGALVTALAADARAPDKGMLTEAGARGALAVFGG